MALTITNVSKQDVGDGQRIIADVLFDSSYPHGGEPITVSDLGFRIGLDLEHLAVQQRGDRLFEYVDGAAGAGKLVARDLVQPGVDYITNRPLIAIGDDDAAEIRIVNIVRCVVAAALSILELAAAEHAFTATTHDITADADTAQEAYYLLSTTDGAAVVVTKGTTADVGTAVPPAIPADAAPIGFVKIIVAAGAVDFNATTDDLDASHLTTTFEDYDRQVYQGTDLTGLTTRVVAYGR